MNPFDDEDGVFHVLRNDEEQHSLWPSFLAVPDGWEIVKSETSRKEALEYVEEHWDNILPRSVRERISAENKSSTDGSTD